MPLAWIVSSLLGALGGLQPLRPPPGALLTLSRGPCFGRCPVYTLTIGLDGRIDYDGQDFVREKGHRRGKLKAAQVQALTAAFAAAKFSALRDEYPCACTDNPTTQLCLGGAHPKCVSYEPGMHFSRGADAGATEDPGGPRRLVALVDEIEETADVSRWVETLESYRQRVHWQIFHQVPTDLTPAAKLAACGGGGAGFSSQVPTPETAKVGFRITLDASGSVIGAVVTEDASPDQAREACLLAQIAGWHFHKPPHALAPVGLEFKWPE